MIQLSILIKSREKETTRIEVITTAPDATTWSCDHAVDWSTVNAELRSLSSALRRVVLRRREVSTLALHGQLVFDLLFPDELKRLIRNYALQLCSYWNESKLPMSAPKGFAWSAYAVQENQHLAFWQRIA